MSYPFREKPTIAGGLPQVMRADSLAVRLVKGKTRKHTQTVCIPVKTFMLPDGSMMLNFAIVTQNATLECGCRISVEMEELENVRTNP